MNRRKGILIISALDFWSMGEGKGGPALWRTLKGYAERGWQVHFITGNKGPNRVSEFHPNINVIRFDARWLKKLMGIKKLGFFAKALWWIWFQSGTFFKAQRLRGEYPIDVVYGYEICGVPVAKLVSTLWHVPIVSRFQGTSLRVFWMNKSFWRIRRWEDIIGLKMPVNLVIMTNDGTQGDRVLQQLGVDMGRVRFWMNGVDWELFKRIPERQKAIRTLNVNSEHILLTISRLARWKRVDRAIRALPGVLWTHPETLLVVVGDGPERERLEVLAFDLGVRDRVLFEGAVPHQEIPRYLASADIFLSLYDWSNVGNPLLEAMMAGKCIITLNNGDTNRFVKDGQNGILLEYEDLPRLPEVINSLLVDEKRKNELGMNARNFAKEHFWSWEERLGAEVQAVESLLG